MRERQGIRIYETPETLLRMRYFQGPSPLVVSLGVRRTAKFVELQ